MDADCGSKFNADSHPKLTKPGDEIVVNTHEYTTGNNMTYTAEVNGIYSGPTDLVGVNNYSLIWNQINPTSIEVNCTATLLRSTGESFDVELKTIYTDLAAQMPSQQQGTLTFSNLSYSDNTLSFDWQGDVSVVPEPTSAIVLFSGLLFTWGYRRKYRLM